MRGQWGIEHSGQSVLAVPCAADRSRVRTGPAPQQCAVVRPIALKLLRPEPSPGSIATQRFRAAVDEHYLRKVLRVYDAIALTSHR